MPRDRSRAPVVAIGRRRFLRRVGAGVSALALGGVAAPTVVRAAEVVRASGKRVVIVGGGVGGTTVAVHLRRLAPDIEVVLVEPSPALIWAPGTFDYLFGRRDRAHIAWDYARLTAQGVRVVKAAATTVDPAHRTVTTGAGTFEYTALVLATGIRLASEAIEGLTASGNLSPYDPAALDALRDRIAAFAGGRVVVSVPAGALKCPPAPYEFALLLAHHLKTRNVKGRVTLLDAWPTPQPDALSTGLGAALSADPERIEHVPQVNVAKVDPAARKVLTAEGDEFEYDLLCLIPPNRVSPLVAALGLGTEGDIFADVDPITFRARRYETMFAVGDVARTPYGRNAAAAHSAAILCAREIARALGAAAGPASTTAKVDTACYPFITPEETLKLQVAFTATAKDLNSQVASDNAAAAANRKLRRDWETAVRTDLFGS
jgi:NADH dehydrogenase FAD-containing subunit